MRSTHGGQHKLNGRFITFFHSIIMAKAMSE
jgi:hypothetical protein